MKTVAGPGCGCQRITGSRRSRARRWRPWTQRRPPNRRLFLSTNRLQDGSTEGQSPRLRDGNAERWVPACFAKRTQCALAGESTGCESRFNPGCRRRIGPGRQHGRTRGPVRSRVVKDLACADAPRTGTGGLTRDRFDGQGPAPSVKSRSQRRSASHAEPRRRTRSELCACSRLEGLRHRPGVGAWLVRGRGGQREVSFERVANGAFARWQRWMCIESSPL
jgi:hypothetical protein